MTTDNLAAKIAKASKAIGTLSPDKTHQQNYNYISADKILGRAGEALAEQGVVVFPAIRHEATETINYTDQYNKPKMRYDAVVEYEMKVSDGKESETLPWVGRGTDFTSPDKALYKAITTGHKYFLVKLLNIGAGNEDGEHEVVEEPAPQPQQQAQRKPQPPREESFPNRPERKPPEDLTPSTAESTVITGWQTGADAKAWAVLHGHAKNEDAAHQVWSRVKDAFGPYTKANAQRVHLAFLREVTGEGVPA